ncbi:hypothetical protein JS61_07945 (plasmid) [Rickettsia felis]|uniref:hypothetical protein n=1 Tax=Rickettsia felis TaxID=42862 RepID=UPI000574EF64|nr:hypothetical protein [Rickettsia felis]KHO02148.1 hypothetical protein JS61_07945 [Rickettsia felis]
MRVKTIPALTLLWMIMQMITNVAFAQYLDEQLETNINKVDPLFERSVPNLEEFKTGIEEDKKAIAEQIGQNIMPPIADSDKIANERAKLESLDVLELDGIARAEMAKDPFHNEMFVDLSRPGMQAHLEDAKKIARGSSKMINNILTNLKDLGVDCKTVKGNIEKDPEYFMEFEKEADRNKGDTIYDQYFCERARRSYSCNDELRLRCLREGREWLQWQDRTIDMSGEKICRHRHHWLSQGALWKKKKRGRKTKKYYHMNMRQDISVQQEVRMIIAEKLGVEIEQINQNIGINLVGMGNLTECRRYEVKWDVYHFRYQYRDWKKICTSWEESWHERCRLKS